MSPLWGPTRPPHGSPWTTAGHRRPGGPPPADTSPAWSSPLSLLLETPGTEPVPLCIPRGAYAFPRRPHPVATACRSWDTFSGVCGATLRWRPSAQASGSFDAIISSPASRKPLLSQMIPCFLSHGRPRSRGLVKRLCLAAVSLEGVIPPVYSERAFWTAVSSGLCGSFLLLKRNPCSLTAPDKGGLLSQEHCEPQGCVQRGSWKNRIGAPGQETPPKRTHDPIHNPHLVPEPHFVKCLLKPCEVDLPVSTSQTREGGKSGI